jgi:hypothetical protein
MTDIEMYKKDKIYELAIMLDDTISKKLSYNLDDRIPDEEVRSIVMSILHMIRNG